MSGAAQPVAFASVVFHICFAVMKLLTGVVGNSFALVADGIESLADVFSSLVVWSGLRFADREADANHPYGHGKAESLAAFTAALTLAGSGVFIAVQAVQQMGGEPTMPAFFTLPVVLVVLVGKESLYQFLIRRSRALHSEALAVEAWNHRLDCLTTLAVLAGLLLSWLAGPAFAAADDVAALLIGGVIVFNAVTLARPSVRSLLDTDVETEHKERIERLVCEVPGVKAVESLRLTRNGSKFVLDIHVEVDPHLTVLTGHRIAHAVRDRLQAEEPLRIGYVFTHVEPYGER